MLDIEVIKWGCEFADGFSWKNKKCMDGRKEVFIEVICYFKHQVRLEYFKDNPESMDYGYFLQRVIEGINKNPKKYYIELCRVVTVVNIDDGSDFMMFNTADKSIDQAKEQAIKYIYSVIN